jgi:hypothetical protein
MSGSDLLPDNLGAEESLLGAMLLSPLACLDGIGGSGALIGLQAGAPS